jgi:hypothetical protein
VPKSTEFHKSLYQEPALISWLFLFLGVNHMTLKVFQENGKYVLKRLGAPGAEAQVISVHESAEEAQSAAKEPLSRTEHASERVYDAFVMTRPGEAYRLLPFGQIKRAAGGPTHNLTPESAAKFKLPHFKPPVKMGSHRQVVTLSGSKYVTMACTPFPNGPTRGKQPPPMAVTAITALRLSGMGEQLRMQLRASGSTAR